jgi:quinol monooxygenase YgiN
MTDSAKQSAFVVIAEFQVRTGQVGAFLKLAQEDARSSVSEEPGCRTFDVAVSEDDMQTVLFYEVYDNRAAFDAHLKTPHLARFRAGIPVLVESERTVRFLRRAYSGTIDAN